MAEFLPGFDINSWGGICGPAGLPPAVVEKLLGARQEGARERRRQEGLPQAGRDAAVDEPGRHRRLSRAPTRAAGAGDQGLGREGGLIAPAIDPSRARGSDPRRRVYNDPLAGLGCLQSKKHMGGTGMVRVVSPAVARSPPWAARWPRR